jgi:hypothetical protein
MRTKEDVDVIEYARSLMAHGFYDNMNDATKESLRFYKKSDNGLIEPMKCPHRLGIEIEVKTIDGKIVSSTHTLKKRKE